MSDFEVLVYRINQPVVDHPDADRLSLVYIEGYTCISAKLEDGSHRYKEGDLVVYIPEGAVLPEWMMKQMDFWDVNKDKPAFRYVKAKKLRGIFSQGILYPTEWDNVIEDISISSIDGDTTDILCITEGENVADFLGIVKYEPPVPTSMAGQVSGAYIKYTKSYDFESIQKHSSMFDEGEPVSVTEKIHGTLIQIGFIPELTDPELFNGNLFVTSKGMGKQGCVYKNLPINDTNLYVKTVRELLEHNDLYSNLKHFAWTDHIYLFGEVFGAGVQDLHYGQKKPTMQLFDIYIKSSYTNTGRFVNSFALKTLANNYFKLTPVPVLYEGPFDRKLLESLRDGKDFSGTHMREGIVIKSATEEVHPKYGRKIAKWVSPDYLLRKNGTEHN